MFKLRFTVKYVFSPVTKYKLFQTVGKHQTLKWDWMRLSIGPPILWGVGRNLYIENSKKY